MTASTENITPIAVGADQIGFDCGWARWHNRNMAGGKERPRSWPSVALVVLIGLVAVFTSSASSAGTGAAPSMEEPAPDEANADLQDYASAYGVSVETAIQQWVAIERARELQAALNDKERNTFGGLWIDYKPSFAVVVMVLPGAERTTEEEIERYSLTDVARIQRSEFTLKELMNQQASLHEVAPFAVDFASAIDIRTGHVEIYVEGKADYDAMSDSDLPAASLVVEDELPTPAAVYGGLSITNGCTTGFSVEQTNGFDYGVTTAGHCGNSASFGGTNLPFQEQQYSGPVDAQWHTTPGEADPNLIRVNVSGATRTVNARRPWNQLIDGEPVCKYGRTTNYDCGPIWNFNYDPSDNCVPSSSATFVRVEPNPNAGDMAQPGDSGGPVFHDNPATAYGQIVCHFTSDDDMIFMPQNFMPAGIGVQVDI